MTYAPCCCWRRKGVFLFQAAARTGENGCFFDLVLRGVFLSHAMRKGIFKTGAHGYFSLLRTNPGENNWVILIWARHMGIFQNRVLNVIVSTGFLNIIDRFCEEPETGFFY